MQANFKYAKIFFILSFLLILYVFYRMLEPFLIAVILGVTLVSLFYPNYLDLNKRLKGHSNLSSLIMCTIITLLIILPLILFFLALFNEINSAYADFRQQLRTGQWGLKIPVPENTIVEMFGNRLVGYLGVEEMDLTLIASSIVDRVARYLLDHYSSILGGIGAVFFKFFIMVFSMFFFFRDGDLLLRELKSLIPMAPNYKDMVVNKLREVTYATFFGIFGTGICQGVAAGMGPRNLLWARLSDRDHPFRSSRRLAQSYPLGGGNGTRFSDPSDRDRDDLGTPFDLPDPDRIPGQGNHSAGVGFGSHWTGR